MHICRFEFDEFTRFFIRATQTTALQCNTGVIKLISINNRKTFHTTGAGDSKKLKRLTHPPKEMATFPNIQRYPPGEDGRGEALNRWHSVTAEQPCDIGQIIIDAHHHLWDRCRRIGYSENVPTHTRYLADEMFDDITRSGHRVVDTVYVECLSMYDLSNVTTPSRGEIEFVQGISAQAKSNLYGNQLRCCGAIIGFVDLTQDTAKVGADLDEMIASGRNFRGIRHAYGYHTSEEIPANHHPTRTTEHLLSDPKFRGGFQELASRNLVFDAWGYHWQLNELKTLADAFPQTTIIVDHLGGPVSLGPYAGQRDNEVLNAWTTALGELAECKNVVVKLGGVGMPIFGLGSKYHERVTYDAPSPSSDELASAWSTHINVALTAFGPERCMFESNFPVDKVTCSYNNMWNAFKKIVHAAGLTQEDRDHVFWRCAAKTYNIETKAFVTAGIVTDVESNMHKDVDLPST